MYSPNKTGIIYTTCSLYYIAVLSSFKMYVSNMQKINLKKNIENKKQKERSSPGLRTWSPTVLLAWPEHA